MLYDPTSAAQDSSGNILIADRQNNRIRKVFSVSGIITTYAGTGSAGFSGDGGPATSAMLDNPLNVDVDNANNVYISDSNNCRVRMVNAASQIITTIVGNGTCSSSGRVRQACVSHKT